MSRYTLGSVLTGPALLSTAALAALASHFLEARFSLSRFLCLCLFICFLRCNSDKNAM